MSKVIVIGASGHGKVVADVIRAAGNEVLGFLDDDKNKEVLGPIADYTKYDVEFIIAIGDSAVRERLSKELDCEWHTAIHPTAVVSPSAVVGEGTVVMPNAVINADAVIGKHCIVNTAAIVEHDDVISDYPHVSVGAKLGGNVRLGKSSWIGIGAIVNNNKAICANCIVGSGAVVIEDIKEAGNYVGCPAKKIK